jgi:amino acid permease
MMTYTSRKLVLTIQALQLLDAFLVWLGFWLASVLRDPVRELLGMRAMGSPMLADMGWVLYIAVPFTPLVLDFFGFYGPALGKPRRKSFLQIAKTVAVMGLVLGAISALSRLPNASRIILVLGALIIPSLLLLRDRVTCWRTGASDHGQTEDTGAES